MGEWSDYFEDFPEEAPQPPSAEEIAKAKLKANIKAMNADAFALIAETKRKAQGAEQQQKELKAQAVESIEVLEQDIDGWNNDLYNNEI